MVVRIHYHANCFDGAVSAALFSRFYREKVDPAAQFDLVGQQHKPGPAVYTAEDFDAEVNAVVDFRYSSDPRLTWFFDHHVTSFTSEADRTRFETAADPRHFFDPTAPSCAGFMARCLAAEHGFDSAPMGELLQWADLIDSASFPDAEMAVALREPSLRIATWLENNEGQELSARLIQEMAVPTPLETLVGRDYVATELEAILSRHESHIELFRRHLEMRGGVAYTDLTGHGVSTFNKFIPYALHGEAQFSVAVSVYPGKVKVSVGSNPWKELPAGVNIGELCASKGGGGHPAVGAFSRPEGGLDEALALAQEMVDHLTR